MKMIIPNKKISLQSRFVPQVLHRLGSGPRSATFHSRKLMLSLASQGQVKQVTAFNWKSKMRDSLSYF